MAKLTKEQKAAMRKQAAQVLPGGVFIRPGKGFTSGRYRILPWDQARQEMLGYGYTSVFIKNDRSRSGWTSTVSPAQYGLPCPVTDWREDVLQSGDEEDQKFLKSVQLRISTEYLIAVQDRNDPGTPDHPKFRLFPCKPTVYQQITQYLADEDVTVDITDPVEGFDIKITREGSGLNTVWAFKVLPEPCPLSDMDAEIADKEHRKLSLAIAKKAEKFTVPEQMRPVNLENLRAIYEILTGEDIPQVYLDAYEGSPHVRESGDDDSDDKPRRSLHSMTRMKDDPEEEELEEEESEEEESEEVEGVDINTVIINETLVSFDDDGTETVGLVTDAATDTDELTVEVDGDEWVVPASICALYEEETEEETEEEEPEEEEEPPAKPAPRKAVKKKASSATRKAASSQKSKSATAKKTTTKQTAKKGKRRAKR